MFVCCECCIMSGRGLCDGPITRSKSSTDCDVSGCELETSTMRRATRATGWCLAMSIGSLGKGFVGLRHVNLYFWPIYVNIRCSNQRCAFNALVSLFYHWSSHFEWCTLWFWCYKWNKTSSLHVGLTLIITVTLTINTSELAKWVAICTWQVFHTPRITSWKRIKVVDVQLHLFLGLELCGQEMVISPFDSLTVFIVRNGVWISQASGDADN
jgi:hypothetical protein